LLDDGHHGQWVAEVVDRRLLVAPDIALVETASALRRLQLTGHLARSEATLAHRDLLDLVVQLWPYEAVAPRAWELRESVTLYDAVYVAVAEATGSPLVTLDSRLARAPGPRCDMLTPTA